MTDERTRARASHRLPLERQKENESILSQEIQAINPPYSRVCYLCCLGYVISDIDGLGKSNFYARIIHRSAPNTFGHFLELLREVTVFLT